MSEEKNDQISILIVSTQPTEMSSIEKFLSKRGFRIVVKEAMREALAYLARNKPDWVFLSMNLGAAMEKYNELFKGTFKVEPIFFADIMDRRSMAQLKETKAPSISAPLTGPVVQMKLAQILADKEKLAHGDQPAPKKTVGVRPSAFLHVKGEATANLQVVMNAKSAPAGIGANGKPMDRVNVMIFENGETRGYVVIGADSARSEVEKMRSKIVADLLGGDPSQASILATIEVPVESFPELVANRSVRSKTIAGESGETVMTCFIPEGTPLPEFKSSPADPTKFEINFKDIPIEKQLPCPMYVHLPQNNKFVCLIKGQGQLSAKQQERLASLGVPSLMIAKTDLEVFKMFYIREKLAARKQEESLSA